MLLKSLKAFLSHLSPRGNKSCTDVDSSPSPVSLSFSLSHCWSLCISLYHSVFPFLTLVMLAALSVLFMKHSCSWPSLKQCGLSITLFMLLLLQKVWIGSGLYRKWAFWCYLSSGCSVNLGHTVALQTFFSWQCQKILHSGTETFPEHHCWRRVRGKEQA